MRGTKHVTAWRLFCFPCVLRKKLKSLWQWCFCGHKICGRKWMTCCSINVETNLFWGWRKLRVGVNGEENRQSNPGLWEPESEKCDELQIEKVAAQEDSFFFSPLTNHFNACVCANLRVYRLIQIYEQWKLPIAILTKEALSMTNKSTGIHEIWLTARHTWRPKDWPCAVSQRRGWYFIEMWNVFSWCRASVVSRCMKTAWSRGSS